MLNTKTNTTTITYNPNKFKTVSPCLICGEGLEYVGHGVCDKCRRAILKVRREMEWTDGATDDK